MPSHADLLTELNALVRLTAVEADVARSRSVQARDDATRDELLQNARHADLRRLALQREVTALGGVPDLLGVALDRALNAARTQVLDQAMPLRQALMGDLVLEHQLRDRAALARVLAGSIDEHRVAATLQRVEDAHLAAIEWIEARLGEVALGGRGALRPTPVQTVAAVGQRVATLPSRAAAAGLNRGIAWADRVGDRIGDRLGRGRELADAAGDAFGSGRDTFLREAEEQSSRRGEDDAAGALHRVRAETGSLTAKELPIARFENLSAAQAVARIRALTDAEDVRAVRAFEVEHKDRTSVLRAADERIGELGAEAMNSR